MRYFTRRFIHGATGPVARQEAVDAYAGHLASLDLSIPLQILAGLNLHDAQILKTTFDPTLGALQLVMRRGNLRVGYFKVSLNFFQARMSKNSFQLLEEAVQPSQIDILASELERYHSGYRFRLLLWPKGEVGIAFENVRIRSTSAGRQHATKL